MTANRVSLLKIQNWYKKQRAKLYTAMLARDFGAFGRESIIFPPFKCSNASGIYVGNDCKIHSDGWIDCIKEYGDIKYNPQIDIGDGTSIGHYSHIIASEHMIIGKNVLIANGVYITDNFHDYCDVHHPTIHQPLMTPGPVIIEDEVWLGERVCVLPNVTIGRHSVIGSNSVVTKSIPDYCVAVGIPAVVIKRYDIDKHRWVRVQQKSKPDIGKEIRDNIERTVKRHPSPKVAPIESVIIAGKNKVLVDIHQNQGSQK